MVAYASYAARAATLFSVYSVATASLQAYTADTNPLDYCGIATVTVYEYAPPLPTTNAHGHGGPYYNPYNDVPLPYQWPGKPSAGHSQASPHPTTPYQYGGPARHAYDAPAWIPKGQNRLKSSFPKGKQNGASSWGELDCPRLPISGLPRGSSHPSHVVSSSHTKSTAHLLPPYPYHSSFSAPASSLADALETTPPTTHSSFSVPASSLADALETTTPTTHSSPSLETSVFISLSDDSTKTALPTLLSGNATHTTFPTSVSGSSAETAISTSIFGNSTVTAAPTSLSSNSTVTAAPTSLSSNSTGTAFLTSFSGNSTQTAFLTAISGNSTKVAFPTAISGNATNVAFPTSASSNATKTAFLDSVSSNATRTAFPTSFSGNASRTAFPTSYSGNATSVAFPTSYSSSATPVPACPTMPDTGVTRTYEMHLAYQTVAPDGVTRNGLTINGQLPGPMVEANWGDWILFKVTNDLTDEGTTIHAHGLLQKETPWFDGVPAVAQCPIAPNGGTLDMLFRADRYGSSWYHSHYSAQYSGGAHGPLIIYGPKHAEYDVDVGPIQLEDWYHADYYTLINNTMNGNFPPSNNNLINGKMQYPCANTTLPCEPNAGIAKFKFESGKKHLLRLMNTGAEGTQKFSIDGHTFKVIAQDFVPVEPYTTNVITLSIGQRADVVVEAVGKPSNAYWMRSQLGTEHCTLNDGISPNAVAAVYYEDADTESVPTTVSDVTAEQLAFCKNDPLTDGVPLCKIPLEEPTTTETISFDFGSNGTNFIWFVNGQTYRGDYNNPILPQAKNGILDYKPEWNVFNFGSNSSVRLILVNHGLIGGHPMHLHGQDFHVLAEGFGAWDGTITNPANTVRRDVHILQNAQSSPAGVVLPSYMVIQFKQENAGVWPLHCHLAWHVSGGLFMNVLSRPDDLAQRTIHADVLQGCVDWSTYTASNVPNQIDSGL